MNGVLEKNLLEELEDIQKNLTPRASVVFTTVMCDCTGWCYGDCQGDCQGSCKGEKNYNI